MFFFCYFCQKNFDMCYAYKFASITTSANKNGEKFQIQFQSVNESISLVRTFCR